MVAGDFNCDPGESGALVTAVENGLLVGTPFEVAGRRDNKPACTCYQGCPSRIDCSCSSPSLFAKCKHSCVVDVGLHPHSAVCCTYELGLAQLTRTKYFAPTPLTSLVPEDTWHALPVFSEDLYVMVQEGRIDDAYKEWNEHIESFARKSADPHNITRFCTGRGDRQKVVKNVFFPLPMIRGKLTKIRGFSRGKRASLNKLWVLSSVGRVRMTRFLPF